MGRMLGFAALCANLQNLPLGWVLLRPYNIPRSNTW